MVRSPIRVALFATLAILLAAAGAFSLSRARAQETPILGIVIAQGPCAPTAGVPVSEVALTGAINQQLEDDSEFRGVASSHVPLAYTDSTYQEATVDFDGVLESPHSVMVLTDSADFSSVVACGEVGGIVRNDEVAIGLYPQNDSGMSGVAFLRDDGGNLAVRAYIMASMATVTPASPVPPATPSVEPSAAAGGAETANAITVEMVDIAFNPKEITIPANTDVTISLPNNGVAVHNFNVDDLGVSSGDVPAGQTATVTINAEPGEYEYYCSVPGHREAGMVGKLIVQ